MKRLALERVTAALALVAFLLTAGTAAVGAAPMPLPQGATNAGPAATNALGPLIQFAASLYDFGKVPAGEVIKHAFVFTNVGERLLQITDVRPSCGCTAPGSWSRQTEPGKTGLIPIELYTANFNGSIAKSVTVTSNATNQPVVTLQIRGTVWRPIEVSPQSAVLNFVPDSASNGVAVVRIVNNLEEPLTLSEPESSNRALAAELKTNQPGKEYQLVIKTVPPLGSTNVFGRISLKTSSPKLANLVVPVYALAQQAVTAIPSRITLPAGPISNVVAQTVSIRSLWANALALSEPAVNAKGVEVQLKELQPGHFFTLTATFPQGFEAAQGERLELSVKSNHPQYPVIKVPVVQPPRPVPVAAPPRLPVRGLAAQPPLPPPLPPPPSRP